MPLFEVQLEGHETTTEHFVAVVEIEADSEEEAIAEAEAQFATDKGDFDWRTKMDEYNAPGMELDLVSVVSEVEDDE